MTIAAQILVLGLVFGAVPHTSVAHDVASFDPRDTGIKVVESYGVDFHAYEIDPVKAERSLTNVEYYNAAGRVAERWDIENRDDGAFYTRHVFTYDRSGNTTAELTYRSTPIAPGRLFSVSRKRTGVKILPEVTDSLSTVELRAYNRAGDIVEIRTSDSEGNLTERSTIGYDGQGRRNSYRRETGDGRVINQSATVYKENGNLAEETYSNPTDGSPGKVITRKDAAGREILEEQYAPRDGASGDKDHSLVLTSRAVHTYTGDTDNMEWTIYNTKGEPMNRLLIVGVGDDEVSRKEFDPPGPSDKEGDRPRQGWTLRSEEICERQYDARHTLTRFAAKTREAKDKTFHYSNLIESVVSYY